LVASNNRMEFRVPSDRYVGQRTMSEAMDHRRTDSHIIVQKRNKKKWKWQQQSSNNRAIAYRPNIPEPDEQSRPNRYRLEPRHHRQ
jgi:hypothetical protein